MDMMMTAAFAALAEIEALVEACNMGLEVDISSTDIRRLSMRLEEVVSSLDSIGDELEEREEGEHDEEDDD